MSTNRLTSAVLASLLCWGAVGSVSGQVASQIATLTGNQRTRIVWLEGGTRLHGGGRVMGYDSQDDAAVQILPAVNNQNRPIICSGGHRIVVTRNYTVYVANWDGSGLREITTGICSDVWQDPNTGLEWAVVRKGGDTNEGEVRRYLIENPSQSLLLWDKTEAGDEYMNWYQISADGNLAADFLPWDHGFAIDSGGWVANGYQTSPVPARGCWSTLASDNSYYWVHLPLRGIGHAGFNVYRGTDTVITQMPITAPKPAGTTDECYHPRFASKGGRFITLTRGWGSGTDSDACEVYLGKFNASYTGFDGWVRLTDNGVRDYTPDAWVGVSDPSPTMQFSSDSLAFAADEGGANPAAQTQTVTTPLSTLTGLTVDDDAAWLTVSAVQVGQEWQIANTVNVAGLTSGVYRATVSVHCAGAVPPIRTYGVKVTVSGTPAAASIRVAPLSAMVVRSGTVQLTATVYDQMEQAMNPQPSVTWSVAGAANGVGVSNGLVTAGTTTGTVRVVAAVGAVADTADVSVVEFIPVHIRVNCGDNGPGYVPGWEGDAQYLVPGHEGSWWPGTDSWTIDLSGVTNPPPSDIYKRFRGESWWTIPADKVPPGSYRVRLHFQEPYNDGTSPRAIDCDIEGTRVMNDMRILDEAGGVKFKAVVMEYDVTVDGDGIQINLGGNSAMILGFEVISSGSLAREITLLEPVGGQVYRVGETMTVRWSALSSVTGVVVEASPDNGETWCLIVSEPVSPDDAAWGSIRWTVTETLQETNGSTIVPTVSDSVRVRVRDYTRTDIWDQSPGTVSILPGLAVDYAADGGRRAAPLLQAGRTGLVVTMSDRGPHCVELFTLNGERLARVVGRGRARYTLEEARGRCVVVRVRTGGRTILNTAMQVGGMMQDGR